MLICTALFLIAAGRLGLRGGELAHFRKDWVDFEKQVINIPAYQDCNCGYCRQQAELLSERLVAERFARPNIVVE